MNDFFFFFFFQAEDGIRDYKVTGVQTCALPIYQGSSPPVSVELGLRPQQVIDPVGGSPERRSGWAVAVRSDGLAVAGVGSGGVSGRLAVFEPSAQPMRALGAVDVPAPVRALATQGAFAYALLSSGAGVATLQVVDLSNTVLPRLRGSIELPGSSANAVVVDGRLAYVANGEAGIAVVDVADPDGPQRIETVPVVGTALDVA